MTPVTDRQSVGERVADEIRRMILDGALRRGERIRREELAETLGVSQIPLREAIIALHREGWVTIEPHKGAFVQGIDVDYVRDHVDLLADIWALVAHHAAEHASTEELEDLATLADAVRSATSQADSASAGAEFMGGLLAAGGSPSVAAVLDLMTGVVPNTLSTGDTGPRPRTPTLEAVVKSLKSRRPEDAANAIAELIRSHGAAVLETLARRDEAVPIASRAAQMASTTARRSARSS